MTEPDAIIAGLSRLHAGDQDARWPLIAAVFDRFRPKAAAELHRRRDAARWEQTGDVMGEAAVRMHRALETTRPDTAGGLFGLFCKKLREVAIDFARKHSGPGGDGGNHRTGRYAHGGPLPAAVERARADTSSPERLAEWTEFHAAADALPDDVREVWDLRYYAGMSEEEVAFLLGVTARTVRRRFCEGKIALAEHLPGDGR